MHKYLSDTIKEFETNNDINLLLKRIMFFQHERLVHLLVTIFTGIVASLFFISFIYLENILIGLLFIIMIILFIFYIFHYYFLENGIQKLYYIYDRLYKKANN